ncbi:unnamed protein product [Phytophthora lilii]|uniref:Unnamed protein product n=1 Tax=Phytophthora lilii TaxID=2077276 RepID=A0A9W6U6P5_9STRA|nr:unnamed protein product [Phytophthora lilii]
MDGYFESDGSEAVPMDIWAWSQVHNDTERRIYDATLRAQALRNVAKACPRLWLQGTYVRKDDASWSYVVTPVLDRAFIRPASMASQRANGNTFHYYPYALYATDVEASVAFLGRVVFLTNHVPGSVSDFTFLANHVEEHKAMLKKTNQELLIEDNGEGANQYQGDCLQTRDTKAQARCFVVSTRRRSPRMESLPQMSLFAMATYPRTASL